ncbi:MAG: DNA alkylation repair protein [Kiritimatiellae bacterium]|jgi:3-methyladenine DNA glycosylase AlkD|nr:DNA alkylation repair protein [Kiritimatiellia bacterium]NLD88855.1 DNA alkylation repair protein [Lentisphaerota bacterium]HPC20198.1 DNA alkylation repair protein [Kiritimatiellia bacterium]
MTERRKSATVNAVLRELKWLRHPAQAAILQRFFKTGPGEYGEGDVFWGLKVPQTRAVLARFPEVSLAVANELLDSPVHEARFFAVAALVRAYAAGGAVERRAIFDFYLARAERVNNWDLVDASAPGIVGRHLPPGGGRRVLAKLAKSANLWERRIAMVATLEHIRQGCLENTFWLAGRLLADPEDLMHKAAGWMLREAGKRDRAALEAFLAAHAARMPRTMLRYAIERLPVERRRAWLQTPRMPRNVQTSLQCRAGRV